MDFRLLRYFTAAVEAKSLHAAAEVLHVSQPALSKAIHNLEQDLGVPLLERRPRGVAPTPYGEALLRYAKMIASDVRHARAEIDALRGASKGEINIGAVPTMIGPITDVAAEILASHPGLKLNIRAAFSAELTAALLDGEIDLAIVLLQDSTPPIGLTFEPLRRTDPVVVARVDHPLRSRTELGLADLVEHPWLFATYPATHRKIISQVFMDAGVAPPVAAMEVSTVVFFASLVRQTDMLTVMPRTMLAGGMEGAGVAPLPVTFPFPTEYVGLAYRENARLLPGAKVVLERIRAACAP